MPAGWEFLPTKKVVFVENMQVTPRILYTGNVYYFRFIAPPPSIARPVVKYCGEILCAILQHKKQFVWSFSHWRQNSTDVNKFFKAAIKFHEFHAGTYNDDGIRI